MHGARCQGPNLKFDLGGMAVNLGPEEYADHTTCAPRVGPLDLDDPTPIVYSFGEMVFRRYYIAFDWSSKQIGFAPIACESSASLEEADAQSMYV
jgi:hypothetical protein